MVWRVYCATKHGLMLHRETISQYISMFSLKRNLVSSYVCVWGGGGGGGGGRVKKAMTCLMNTRRVVAKQQQHSKTIAATALTANSTG